MLDKLPPELLPSLVRHLDVPSFLHLASTSRTWRARSEAEDGILWRAIGEQAGYDRLQTAGDDGLYEVEAQADSALRLAVSRRRTAVRNPRIDTWKSLAKVSWQEERNWRQNKYIARKIGQHGPSGVWRFKVDTRNSLLAASGCIPGQISVQDVGWIPYVAWQAPHCTHVELSNSRLIAAESSTEIKVWRLSRELAHEGHIYEEMPSIMLPPGGRCNCYKARYPYLATAGHAARRIYVFNIDTTELKAEIPFRDDFDRSSRLTYIELDRDYVFLCSFDTIDIYTYDGAPRLVQSVPLWSPSPAVELADDWATVEDSFIALHHYRGTFVALTRFGAILFAPDYPRTLREGTPLLSSTIALVFDPADAITSTETYLSELSVENGRVIFTIQQVLPAEQVIPEVMVTSLLSIDLDQFATIRTRRPEIRVIDPLVPNTRSVTRVESDGATIYAIAQSQLLPVRETSLGQATKKRWHSYLDDVIARTSWVVPNGEMLHEPLSTTRMSEEESEALQRDVAALLVKGFADGEERWPDTVLAYDFGVQRLEK